MKTTYIIYVKGSGLALTAVNFNHGSDLPNSIDCGSCTPFSGSFSDSMPDHASAVETAWHSLYNIPWKELYLFVERWLSWSKALAWKASRWGITLSRGFESLSLRHFFGLAVLDGEVAVP